MKYKPDFKHRPNEEPDRHKRTGKSYLTRGAFGSRPNSIPVDYDSKFSKKEKK